MAHSCASSLRRKWRRRPGGSEGRRQKVEGKKAKVAIPSARRVQIKVADVIDNNRIGPMQVGMFILCALCLILDGFDVQAIGYVAPAIIQEWQIPNSALGPVFGAGNFGVLIGSLVFTMVADKIGRRPVLIGATLFF